MPRRSLAEMGFAKDDVNLTEIAKKLGISPSTVSRALRNVPGIREQTRKTIVRTAQKMGYNIPERSSSRERLQSVLTLSQGHGSSIDRDYLAGISRAAIELDFSIVSHHYQPGDIAQVLDPKHQPRVLSSGAIRAILLMHSWPEEIVAKLAAKAHVVSLVHEYDDLDVDVVTTNDRQGMRQLIRHLGEKGHTAIGFYGFCSEMSWSRSRFGAFVESIHAAGLKYNPAWTVDITLDEALAESHYLDTASLEQAIKLTSRGVTAWVSPSQGTASALLENLLRAGVKVPKQVAVSGFHGSNQPYAPGRPVLTSTLAATEEIGSSALRRVLHRINSPGESKRVIMLPCTLLEGGTT